MSDTLRTGGDELSLREIVGVFWRARWLMLWVTITFTTLAGIAALMLPKKYTATVIFSSATKKTSNSLSGLGSLVTQFGGLASLAGVSLAGDGDKSEAIAVLQSELLTEQYIEEKKLLPILFPKQWDAERKKWRVQDVKKIPTLWKANEFFKKEVRSVAEDKKTGLLSLTITWTDPVTAATWANDLVRVTNDYMRSKAISESEAHIRYLEEQAAKTDVAQVRSAIFSILEAEIKSVMLAKGSDEYSFNIVDPAVPHELPSSPQFLSWIVGGFFGGVFLAIVVVFGKGAFGEARCSDQ